MLEFTVRQAQAGDLDDCIWFDAEEAPSPARDERKRELIENRIRTGDIFLACDSAGASIGYIRIDHLWPMMMPVMGWVYVKPAWREGGVMTALYQQMMETILDRGHTRFMLSTQSNRPGVMDLFKAIGMKEAGRLSIHADPSVEEVFYLFSA